MKGHFQKQMIRTITFPFSPSGNIGKDQVVFA